MGVAKSKLEAGNWDEGSRFELKKFEDLSDALLWPNTNIGIDNCTIQVRTGEKCIFQAEYLKDLGGEIFPYYL